MSGLIEYATTVLSASERRLEIVSHNIANISTPGYKRRVSFSDMLDVRISSVPQEEAMTTRLDDSQGKMVSTGNPLDLAIAGQGCFQLRDGDRLTYTRAGQFRHMSDGTIVGATGGVLQQAGGGDLVLDRAAVEIAPDGTVLDGERPIARIGLFVADNGDMLCGDGAAALAPGSAMIEAAGGQVRQGMIESSNVSVGDEMVTTMAAMRQAETGARLVQVYDELMGRVVSTFAQGGR